MPQEIINVGSAPNDGTGDVLRVSQQKANSNFTELYTNKQDKLTETNFGTFSNGLTTEDAIADADLINYTDVSDANKQKKTTWSNIKAKLALIFQYKLVAGTNITIDNTNPLAPVISALGGGDEFFYIHMNQYVQYSQAPTTWFGRAYGPQNVGWHATANQHNLSIGTNPLSFDAQSPAVTLPFDCQVEEAFVTIQRSNGDNRTLNLRFYAYDIISNVSANIQQVLNISTFSIWGIKSLTTDFTVPANTFTKGQRITTVTNQSSDLTGVAVSWEVLIKLKKI